MKGQSIFKIIFQHVLWNKCGFFGGMKLYCDHDLETQWVISFNLLTSIPFSWNFVWMTIGNLLFHTFKQSVLYGSVGQLLPLNTFWNSVYQLLWYCNSRVVNYFSDNLILNSRVWFSCISYFSGILWNANFLWNSMERQNSVTKIFSAHTSY